MLFLIVLIILAAIFLRGVFRIIIPILLALLVLRLVLGAVFWLLSPKILVPLLIIAGIIWLVRKIRDRRKYY